MGKKNTHRRSKERGWKNKKKIAGRKNARDSLKPVKRELNQISVKKHDEKNK